MRGNAPVRFGGRPGETDRPKDRHRAPGPPNHVEVRDRGRVVSKALVAAYAVHETGLREVIGMDIGEVESGSFWVEFLQYSSGGHTLAVGNRPRSLRYSAKKALTAPAVS